MLQVKSNVRVIDNSGARKVQVIGTYIKNHRQAYILNKVLISVKQLRLHQKALSKVNLKKIYKAFIISTKKSFRRKTNFKLKFNVNSIILLTRNQSCIGSRIFFKVPKELKNYKLFKLISLSRGTI